MAHLEKFGMAAMVALMGVGCSKSGKDGADEAKKAPVKMELSAGDLSTGHGCLSLPKLRDAVEAIERSAAMYAIPVKLEVTGKSGVRSNFQKLLALNVLSIQEGRLSNFHAFEPASQDQCNTVTLTKTDGTQKEFKISTQDENSQLHATSEDGEAIRYELLAPRRVKVTSRYITHDLPCDSEKNNIFVSLTKVIDWSDGGVPASIDTTDDQLAIDSAFLSLAADAAGFPEADLYSISEGDVEGETVPRRVIQVPKVRELSQMAPRPEIVTCDGVVNPDPEPEPDPQPEPLPDEDGDGQPDNPSGPGGPEDPNEEGRV